MGVLASVGFYRSRRAAVGVALTQYGVYRAAFHAVVARLDVFLFVIGRLFRIFRQRVALRLQLGDSRLNLWQRRRDVRQLDDIGVGVLC